MSRYLHNEIGVEAIQYDGKNTPIIDAFISGYMDARGTRISHLIDRRGTCNVSPGDYIVKDRSGRFFVYDEKEFKENFTEVDSNG